MAEQRLIDANALKAKAFGKRKGLIHTADIDAMPSAQPDHIGDVAEMVGDAISRQDVIDAIVAWTVEDRPDIEMPTDLIGRIKALPSVQPEQRWIPCSERLPEDDTLMLVNYIDNRPGAGDIWIGWHEMENVWYIDGEAHSKEFGDEVIAWMPLPEP